MTGNLSPQRFGDYELIERLGSGGFGTVWKARDVTLERVIALKILNAGFGSDPDWVRRFRREATTAAALDHPSIPGIHRFGEVDGRYFIAMRFVPGQTLSAISQSVGPMPLDQLAGILRQIADALDYAHRQQVVHRDVKPANIMVEPGGRAFLTDFGMARLIGVSEAAASVANSLAPMAGTLHYLSPEQFRDEAPGPASDRYALGVTTYELLTRRYPFDGSNPVALGLKVVADSPPSVRSLRPDVPERVAIAIGRMLGKSPAERFATAMEFVRELGTSGMPAIMPDVSANPTAGDGVAEMFEAVRRSVVQVVTSAGMGSGVQVPEGILTNAHVVQDATTVVLVLADGEKVRGYVHRVDDVADLALIRPEGRVPELGSEAGSALRVGEPVYLVGYPRPDVMGVGGVASLSRGIISGFRNSEGVVLIQTDAAMNSGNSGGALVSARGRLVGIARMSIRDTEGMNFAISIWSVTEFLGRDGSRRRPSTPVQAEVPPVRPAPHEAIGQVPRQPARPTASPPSPATSREAPSLSAVLTRQLVLLSAALFGLGGAMVYLEDALVYLEDALPSWPSWVPLVPSTPTPLPTATPIPPTPTPGPRRLIVDASGSGDYRTIASAIRGDYRTIASAIRDARPQDTIVLRPGTYKESLTIDRDVRIVGEGGRSKVIVEGAPGQGAVFKFTAGSATLTGLTIRVVGTGTSTGAIAVTGGTPVIEDCDLTSSAGSAVYILGAGANPVIRNSTMRDSRDSGVYVYEQGQGIIELCLISGNANSGVSIKTGGNPTVRDSEIRNGKGPGVFVYEQGQGTIERCVISGNADAGVQISKGGNPVVRDCKVSGQWGITVRPDGLGTISGCDLTGATTPWSVEGGAKVTRTGNRPNA